jgi:uncharacterized protein
MVAMSEVEALAGRIVEEFDPDKIILFGSHAYGTAQDYSDVDLLVLMPFKGNSFDRATEILERIEHPFCADVIVRDPVDAEQKYQEHDSLIRDAFDRGKVLYARKG